MPFLTIFLSTMALLWSGEVFSLQKFAAPSGSTALHTYQALARTQVAKRNAVYNLLTQQGVSASEIASAFQDGNARTVPCADPCPYETAGYDPVAQVGIYWRNVKPGELIVLIKIHGQWRPVFLQHCANPIREHLVKEPDCQPLLWYTPSGYGYGYQTSHHRCNTIEYFGE